MDEQPAPQEGTELALDEAGQPDPVGVSGGRDEKGLQVFLDYPVQDPVGPARGPASARSRPERFYDGGRAESARASRQCGAVGRSADSHQKPLMRSATSPPSKQAAIMVKSLHQLL